MIRATTPKHSFTFDVNPEETFSEILITYAQNGKIVLEKHKSDLTFEACDCFGGKPVYTAFVKLTQEETKLFAANPKGVVDIQVRAITPSGAWIGFNLVYSANPTTATLKREITVELLAYENCTVELQDELITPTNIPNRAAHTDWYSSTNTSFDNFDACGYGLKQTGDNNTTSISNLYLYNGHYRADSILYRYELLFQTDEDTLTPLNNVSNGYGSTTKTMLTDVEFDPFGRIYYYNSTTTVNPEANIGAGALYWSHSGLDLRYTFNCGSTLTAHKPFYLVVIPTGDGKCKIASDSPWAQDLPTTSDGKWYILLGRTYSTYQMALHSEHPVYYHDGTRICHCTKDQLKLKAIINTLTDTFVDALHNHTKSFEGFDFKTVSGSIVTFDTRDID